MAALRLAASPLRASSRLRLASLARPMLSLSLQQRCAPAAAAVVRRYAGMDAGQPKPWIKPGAQPKVRRCSAAFAFLNCALGCGPVGCRGGERERLKVWERRESEWRERGGGRSGRRFEAEVKDGESKHGLVFLSLLSPLAFSYGAASRWDTLPAEHTLLCL